MKVIVKCSKCNREFISDVESHDTSFTCPGCKETTKLKDYKKETCTAYYYKKNNIRKNLKKLERS